ncbi:MAG: hypothetical protein HQ564_09005 [Candidatus Saganbacteria bacterium]|nr:hypothetical protein [Candidatus Saganbacteria bacterium]
MPPGGIDRNNSNKNNAGVRFGRPLPKPKPDKKLVCCEKKGHSRLVPDIIIPPLGCREVSSVPYAFAELKSAYDAIRNNKRLAKKLKLKKPLSKAEKKIIERFRSARKSLIQLGVNLFNSAFIAEPQSVLDQVYWDQFKAELAKIPFALKKLNLLAVLSDKKLDKNDQALLFSHISSPKSKITPDLTKRIAEHYSAKAKNFNSRGGGYSSSHIFLGVLRLHHGKKGFEKILGPIIKKNLKGFVVLISPKRVGQLLTMRRSDFWQVHEGVLKDFVITAPGTKQRVLLAKTISDLRAIAFARGISFRHYGYQQMVKSIPGLNRKEYVRLYKTRKWSEVAMGNPKSVYTARFLKTFAYYASRYFSAKPAQKSAYASALALLDNSALGFGLTRDYMDKYLARICKRYKCSLAGKGKISEMAALKNKGIVEVSPNGLPKEVVAILKQAGYWKLVSANIQNISFTPEINEGKGIFSMDAGGTAISLLKRVQIDYVNPQGIIVPAWQIALILVHEAAHVRFRKADINLQQSTPNERQAFATQYAFMQKMQVPADKKEALWYKMIKQQAKEAVRTANKILGYKVDNMRPDVDDLPIYAFCKKHGLSKPEELDMGFYPTYPSPDFLSNYSQFVSLAKRIDKRISADTLKILWDVLEGKGSFRVDYKIAGNSVDGVPIVYMVKDGVRKQLNKARLFSVNKFYKQIYLAQKVAKKLIKGFNLLASSQRQWRYPTPNVELKTVLAALSNPDPTQINNSVYNRSAIYQLAKKKAPGFLKAAADLLRKNGKEEDFYQRDLFEAIAMARQMINNPKYARFMEKIKKKHPEVIGLALKFSGLAKRNGKGNKDGLALLDLFHVYLAKKIYSQSKGTAFHTAATLRNILFKAELSLNPTP